MELLGRFTLRRRISLLAGFKLAAFATALAVLADLAFLRKGWVTHGVALVACVAAGVALRAWEQSQRRQFVREARLPAFLAAKLMAKYPQLSPRDADLVLHGLRQFFMAYLRGGHRFVAMPSRVVDEAWHAFILHTRGYESWCRSAFGKLLHHTPAEVLGRDPKRNDGLRRTWYWACKEESINPRQPSRLPLLFALDRKFGIEGGFQYVPDCRDIDRQSGSDAYCGTSFSDDGQFPGDGPANFFGGSESDGALSADSSSDTASDGCGGGCGGGD